jgi:hypothetical protein
LRHLICLVPAVLLAACGSGTTATSDPDQIRAGTDAVRAVLQEPQTAQFRNVESYAGAVCGEVNASVGMGRTGYERFIVKGGKVTLESQLDTNAAMDARVAADCR